MNIPLRYWPALAGDHFRYWLARAGDHLTQKQIGNLKGVLRYLEAGFLMRRLGCRVGRIENFVDKSEDLFDLIGHEVGDKKVLYLEFGVFQGETILYWSKLLSNPESKLHGFDSFEGLPENWNPEFPKGCFTTGGAIPAIDDPRVRFFKGWFDQTIPAYKIPEHEVLVLNFDADLYSSTILALNCLSPYIVPGTFLYFDEFADTHHELRAFGEFSSSSKLTFALRGATKSLCNVLFQCVA
jgi:hypothetical protein